MHGFLRTPLVPCTLEYSELLGPVLRLLIDPPVEDGDDGHRQIESSDRCAESGDRLREELDVALIRRNRPLPNEILPEEDSRSPEDERNGPGQSNHGHGSLSGPFGSVRQRTGDGEIPVEADDQQGSSLKHY